MTVNKSIYLPMTLLIIMALLSCRKSKTITQEKFEKNCYIKIPEEVKVLEDTLYSSPPDYALIYNLLISPAAMPILINSIKKSGHYHITVYKETDNKNLQIHTDDRGVWRSNERGYRFFREEEQNQFSIDVDTIKGTLMAWEGHAGYVSPNKK